MQSNISGEHFVDTGYPRRLSKYFQQKTALEQMARFTDNDNDLQLSPSSASGPFDPLENTTFLIGGLLEPDRIRSHIGTLAQDHLQI